ncbi:BTAD domain-containing putative transcriptional regulator [Micromonospora aurantiaca (nom. illeg.)]
MADVPVRFAILGPVRVVADGGRVVGAGGPIPRAVLALLLARGSIGASLSEIISSVWGEGAATEDTAYHHVSAVRKVLRQAGADLVTRENRYYVAVGRDEVDWHQFRRLVEQAGAARGAGRWQLAADRLRAALDLWRAEPLAGINDRLEPLRRQMTDSRRHAVDLLAETQHRLGRYAEVVQLLSDEVGTDPLREGTAALLIDALTAVGRRDEAGEVFTRVRRRLDAHGRQPGGRLIAAHRRSLRDDAEPAPAATADRPLSGLPRADPHFTDREEALARVRAALDGSTDASFCVIHGMGGSGKTALAVRAAVQLQDSFPDGVIFLDLRGYSGRDTALTPAETLDRLLRRMRVDAAQIPVDPEELAAYFHDLIDDRRLLLVLDNAQDAAQVRPVLPRAGASAAIVTSRRRLISLEGSSVPLDVLDPPDAIRLFQVVVGGERDDADPGVLARIVEFCGRLPLAIRIAAARYRAHPGISPADLEALLAMESSRLGHLDDDERSVAACFRISLDDLPGQVRKTFLLLGATCAGAFDAHAAAAVADLPVHEVTGQLRLLADRHLVSDRLTGRYQFHDLIALFAREHASTAVPAGERAVALHRLADHLLRTADLADRIITPHRYRVPLELLDRDAAVPSLPDYDSALRWLTVEDGNLQQVCLDAAAAGLDRLCWQLAYTLRGYYFLSKRWHPWTVTHEAALAAATRLGDRRAMAMTANNLGLAYLEQHDRQRAAAHYGRARELFGEVGDAHGEHTAAANLAWLYYDERDFVRFLDEMRPVYEFYRREKSERNAAITLRGIALAEAELGRAAEAVADLLVALEVFERLGLRLDAAMALNALGEIYQRTGDLGSAVERFEQAVVAAEQSGSGYEQARAHHRLGELAAADGDPRRAREQWSLAVDGYRQLGAAQVAEVEALLDGL